MVCCLPGFAGTAVSVRSVRCAIIGSTPWRCAPSPRGGRLGLGVARRAQTLIDQYCAAAVLPMQNRRDAVLLAPRRRDVQHMQDDPGPRGARPDGRARMPSVDIEPVTSRCAERGRGNPAPRAVFGALRRALQPITWRCEGVVELPGVDMARPSPSRLRNRRRRGRDPAGSAPGRGRGDGRRCAERRGWRLSTAAFGCDDEPGGAVGELRSRRGGHVWNCRSKNGFSLARFSTVGLAHAVVLLHRACPPRRTPARHLAVGVPRLLRRDHVARTARRELSISRRVIPNRNARFSAVWPISRPTIGSVRPFMMPITGAGSPA